MGFERDVLSYISEDELRRIDGYQLHQLAENYAIESAGRARAAAELRRREAWAAPAGRAYWISVGALVVSLCAVVVSIWSAAKPEPPAASTVAPISSAPSPSAHQTEPLGAGKR